MKTIIRFIKEKRYSILKVLALLLIIGVISAITMAILFATGTMTYSPEHGIEFHINLFEKFTGKWYGFAVFIIVQAVLSILLCAVPGVAMALVILSKVIYPNSQIDAFLLSYASVMLTSTILYTIGRLGGYRICESLLGKRDCEKAMTLLRNRGSVYFPIMMMLPIFPDDALVMLAGTTRMKLKWFIPSVVVCRGIGIATIIFGMEFIPYANLFDPNVPIYEKLILVTFLYFWITEIFKLANKIDRYLNKRRKAKLARLRAEAEADDAHGEFTESHPKYGSHTDDHDEEIPKNVN